VSGAWRRGTIRCDPTVRTDSSVVKIGGSLLARPGWPAEITALLADFHAPLVVVGGGGLVAGLRVIDAACQAPTELMHELAIDAMTLSARLVAEMIGLPLATEADHTAGVVVAASWLRAAGESRSLPAGWQVTSDSIAATVARRSGRALVLAKSVPPPDPSGSLAALTAAGWVDEQFPAAAARLKTIRWAAPA